MILADFDFGTWLQNFLSPSVITTIMSILTMLGMGLKSLSTIKKLTKEKTTTMSDVKSAVVDAVNTTTEETVNNAINEMVKPMQEQLNQLTPVLQTFAKILALSQENTAESRVAILNLIQELGNVGNDVIEKAKNEISTQVEADSKTTEQLDAIIEETTTNSEGRY